MRLILAMAVACLSIVGVADADPVPATIKQQTEIPAQGLAPALTLLAKEFDFQVLYRTEVVGSLRTRGVSGPMTAAEALERVLSGTGLTYKYLDEKTVTIVPAGVSAPSAGSGGHDTVQSGAAGKGSQPKGGDRKKSFWDHFRLAQATPSSKSQLSSRSSDPGARSAQPTARNSDGASGSNNDSTAGAGLEEIVVTAQKRSELLQDVPFGISAITNNELERSGANAAQDYLAEVPGVHYSSTGAGRSAIIIRGISTEGDTFNNLQRTVEVYLDDLPLLDRFSPWTAPDIGSFDIERVEVLRGPQGTLFGSGALGGAIRLITTKPDLTGYHAKIELGAATTQGGADSNNVSGMINMPLIEDELAIRVVGYHRRDGGWVDNLTRDQKNVNGGLEEGGRAIVEYHPVEALKIQLSTLDDQEKLNDSPKVFSDSAAGPSDQWNGIIPERSSARYRIDNLTMDYDFGPATLTSISTYARQDSFLATDFVSALAPILNTSLDPNANNDYVVHNSHRYAEELRLASNGKTTLQWTIGAFYMNYQQDAAQVWDVGPPATLLRDDTILTSNREAALFGEATDHLTDALSLTAGARWFDSRFSSETLSNPAAIITAPAPLLSTRDHAVTPKYSISYYPARDVLLYATASEGYRIGQVNFSYGADPRIPKGFGPDSLWNYEVGIKSQWLDRRLTANGAVYYIDWNNIQLTRALVTAAGFPQNYEDNGGTAVIKGLEGELTARPSDAFEIGSSLSYNDGKLKSVLPGVGLLPGATLPGTPEFNATVHVQEMFNLGRDLSGYLRLDHQYVGKIYFDIENSAYARSDSYNKVDVRFGVLRKNYEFVFYVNNLLDNQSIISRGYLVPGNPFGYTLQPRTLGLTARASY